MHSSLPRRGTCAVNLDCLNSWLLLSTHPSSLSQIFLIWFLCRPRYSYHSSKEPHFIGFQVATDCASHAWNKKWLDVGTGVLISLLPLTVIYYAECSSFSETFWLALFFSLSLSSVVSPWCLKLSPLFQHSAHLLLFYIQEIWIGAWTTLIVLLLWCAVILLLPVWLRCVE